VNQHRCPECGSTKLVIELDTEVTATGIPDGRLKANEIRAIVVVGCEECSATVEVIRDSDRIAVIYPAEVGR
jgi:predicted nucleic-acid-binding Zn-ribbon protein